MAHLEQDYSGHGDEWFNVQPREQRLAEAKQALASDDLFSRGGPFRDGDRIDTFSRIQTARHFGKFRIARGTGKDCIESLRGSMDDWSGHWCFVVSSCSTAGFIMAGDRPAGTCELHFQPLACDYQGTSSAALVLMMALPGEVFAECNAALETAPISVPDAGIGALLVDYILALERRLPSLREDELQPLVEASKSLIAGCLEDRCAREREVGRRWCNSRIQRAHELIRENLSSPTFGEADLRRMLGLSRSSLYRLFTSLGGVKRCIQRERLARARVMLADPLNKKPIFKIAEELCFCDASSFSRAFRNEFGISPRSVRDHSSNNSRSPVRHTFFNFGDGR